MSSVVRLKWTGLVASVVVSAASSVGAATPVTVPNFSFETPTVTSGTGVALQTDDWTLGQTGTTFDTGFGILDIGAGVFTNPAKPVTPTPPAGPYPGGHLDNADGAQVAYIYNNTNNYITQTLTDTFKAGQSYTLTASFADAEAAPPAGDHVVMELYYVDPTSMAQTPIVVATQSLDSAQLSQTSLNDYSITTPVLGAAADGQPIGILFYADPAVNLPTQSQFDLDNVRLSYVPEPASLGLLTIGGALLVVRRRRAAK